MKSHQKCISNILLSDFFGHLKTENVNSVFFSQYRLCLSFVCWLGRKLKVRAAVEAKLYLIRGGRANCRLVCTMLMIDFLSCLFSSDSNSHAILAAISSGNDQGLHLYPLLVQTCWHPRSIFASSRNGNPSCLSLWREQHASAWYLWYLHAQHQLSTCRTDTTSTIDAKILRPSPGEAFP